MKSTTLVIYRTKISPPRLHRVLPRERLFTLLDDGWPVTWVSSPAGSGKTTLMASYARDRGLPVVWYRVDETDNDEATLFYYLHVAAKGLKKGRTRSLPLFTPEYRHGVAAFTRYFFESLFDTMPNPGIIVFDNYQEVSETSPIHDILRNGLALLPEGIRAFIVSRKAPPPPFISLKVQSGLALLGWDEVRFTADEVRAMAEQRKKTPVSPETVTHLLTETRGWAAALILSLDGDRTYSVAPGTLGTSSLFDYFRAEVFTALDDQTKEFLTTTALLPVVAPEIVRTLTGVDTSGDLLAALYRNNYFTELYQNDYRFHPLFREFLLAEAHRSFTPERIRDIRTRAGKLFLDAGRTEEGIELLIAAQEWESFVPALLSAAPRLVAEGRSQTLEGWIREIPERIRNGIPWLLYWLGVCRLPYDAAASCSLIDQAFEMFQEEHDAAGTLFAWSGAVWSTVHGWKLQQLGARVEWLEKYFSAHPTFPSQEVEAAVAIGMAGALTFGMPSHPDLNKWADNCVKFGRLVATNSVVRTQAYLTAMSHCFWLGEYERLATLLSETESSVESGEVLLAVWWHYFKSCLIHYAGPFHKSPVPPIEKGLKICANTGAGLQAGPFLLVQGASGAMDRGDLEKALTFLEVMKETLASVPPVCHAQYHSVASLYCLHGCDIPKALTHIEEMLRASGEMGYPFCEALLHLQATFILTEAGDLGKAKEELAAFNTMPKTASAITDYTHLLAHAALALKEGAPDALDILKEAFEFGRKKGFISPLFSWIPPLMSRLCSAALKAGIEVDHVRYIIRSKGLVPDKHDVLGSDAWPWPVKVHTLGHFSLLINDEPLTFTGRVQKRPLALLKSLIALGGHEVAEETIEDLLWPDAEGDAARDAFKVSLSRLRKLLIAEGAIEVSGGRLSLRPAVVRTDTQALAHVAEAVFSLWENRRNTPVLGEAEQTAQHLYATYKGPFLADEDDPWALACRTRLKNTYLGTLRKLADIFTEAGRDDLVQALYDHAIDTGLAPEEFRRRSGP